MAISSTLRKTTVFLALTTLIIGLGTAATWNSPSDGDNLKDPIEYEVALDSGSQVNVTIDGPNSKNESYSSTSTDTFSIGSGNSGDYTLTAEDDAGTDTIEVTIDGSGPTFDNLPQYTDGSFSIDVTDNEVGVDNISAIVSANPDVLNTTKDKSGCTDCSNEEFEINTDDLDTGEEISVDFTAHDTVGNEGSDSATITFDDSYDGDTSPDVYLEDHEGEDTVRLREGESQDVVIDIDKEDEDTDIRAECIADGDTLTTTDYENPDDDSSEFQCELDGDEHAGETVDFEVELCDKAGNCADKTSREFTFDSESPKIQKLEHPDNVSTFNKDFTLEYLVSDDTGVERLEYTLDSNTNYGKGTQIDMGAEREFTVAVSDSDISSGENTVYVSARDKVNNWESAQFDFNYYPNKQPEISLSTTDSLEVKSNSSKEITLTIENTGEFFIKSDQITGSEGLLENEIEVESLKKDESIQKTIRVNGSSFEVGSHQVKLKSENYDAEKTIELTVRANEEEKQEISNDVQNWVSKKKDLENNISQLGSLSEENQNALEGNISEFKTKVEKAQNASQSGKYYKAKSYLKNIDSEFNQASNTYSEVRTDYQQKMTNRYIMIALAGVFVLGGGAAGFLLYRGDELGLEEISLPEVMPDDLDIEVPHNIPELGLMSKAKGLIGNSEEEEEEEVGYTFEDFT